MTADAVVRAPLVSVVIPTHNRAHYITEAIDSVLAQTYPQVEIIVIDDGSTDNTRDVVLAYGNRVRYIHQPNFNQGPAAALNRGIRDARGTYIALLDDDDVWQRDKLALQIPVLEQDPALGFLGTDLYITDASGRIVSRWGKPPEVPATFAGLIDYNMLGNSSVVIRKTVVDSVGGFDANLRTTQDYDLWLRMAKVARFACLGVPTTLWRIHGNNKHMNKVQKLEDRIRIFTRHGNLDHLSFVQRRVRMAKLYYEYAEHFQGMGLFGRAVRTYLRAVSNDPSVGRHFWSGGTSGIRGWRPMRILRAYAQAARCARLALSPSRRARTAVH
jgi:glycosyltransferase involved in cell wall biosynthesis